MDKAKRVIWTEGILLSQQHFQQNEAYAEYKRRVLVRYIGKLQWGVKDLKIDETALLNKQFRVLQCNALLPSGDIIEFDHSCDGELQYDLRRVDSRKIEVFIGVPNNRLVGGITGYPEAETSNGWQADYSKVRDEYDAGRVCEVLFAKKNILVLTQADEKDGMDIIKIAELLEEEHGETRINREYIPTVAAIGDSKELTVIMQGLNDVMVAGVDKISERYAQIEAGTRRNRGQGFKVFYTVAELNRGLNALQHIQQMKRSCHPETLYRCFLDIVSALSWQTSDNNSDQISRYDHSDFRKSFSGLVERLQKLIEALLPVKASQLGLRRESETEYVVEGLAKENLENRGLYLEIERGEQETSWVEKFIKQVKIGARSSMEASVASALPGLIVKYTTLLPDDIPIKSGSEYFYIEKAGDCWKRVVKEKSLVIHLPKQFQELRISLIEVEE